MSDFQIDGVSKSYGSNKVLDNISLSLEPQETMVIMGPSGCGKTTLLLITLGALAPDQGEVIVGGKAVNNIPIEDRGIGYVPQDFGLFPHLTVYGNIAFGLRVRNMEDGEIRRAVGSLLEAFKLEGLAERKPRELSGGQKQRVALARALGISPSLLLLDEPLSNIDEATKVEVRRNLKDTLTKLKVTTLCVVHDPEDAFMLGDRIAVMYYGRIIQCAAPDELLRDPKDDVVRKLIAPVYVLKRTQT